MQKHKGLEVRLRDQEGGITLSSESKDPGEEGGLNP